MNQTQRNWLVSVRASFFLLDCIIPTKLHLSIINIPKKSNNIRERRTWIRHLSKSHNFIQQDPKRPDVRFDGKFILVDGLRCSPFHWKLGSFFGLINILTTVLIVLLKSTCSEEIKGTVVVFFIYNQGIHYCSGSQLVCNRTQISYCTSIGYLFIV